MPSVSKGQFFARFIILTETFYIFSSEMYKLCEAMKKKSTLIMACDPLLFKNITVSYIIKAVLPFMFIFEVYYVR